MKGSRRSRRGEEEAEKNSAHSAALLTLREQPEGLFADNLNLHPPVIDHLFI